MSFNFSNQRRSNPTKKTTKTPLISDRKLRSLEQSSLSHFKESERLKSQYQTLASNSINQVFKDQITQFYEEFSLHLKNLLDENQELKEMLRGLYFLHMKETGDLKENVKIENLKEKKEEMDDFKSQIKKKYKEELIRVRETLGGQIRKLENELIESLKQLKETKSKANDKLELMSRESDIREKIVKETIEKEIKISKEKMIKEFTEEKRKLVETFQYELTTLSKNREEELKGIENQLENFKKMSEMLKIENENREYELENMNEKLESKENLIENLSLKLEKNISMVENLKKKLKKKDEVIDKQTFEVKKLIQNLQEKKIEFKGNFDYNYNELIKNLEFQKDIVRRLEIENEELRRKNEMDFVKIRDHYEKSNSFLEDKNLKNEKEKVI